MHILPYINIPWYMLSELPSQFPPHTPCQPQCTKVSYLYHALTWNGDSYIIIHIFNISHNHFSPFLPECKRLFYISVNFNVSQTKVNSHLSKFFIEVSVQFNTPSCPTLQTPCGTPGAPCPSPTLGIYSSMSVELMMPIGPFPFSVSTFFSFPCYQIF